MSDEEICRRFDATADLIQQAAARVEAHVDQGCADLKARFDTQDTRSVMAGYPRPRG